MRKLTVTLVVYQPVLHPFCTPLHTGVIVGSAA
jgi:hypothetical protein